VADVEREKGSPKKNGTYFYWSDWSGKEPKGLTYAAKGLWIDMLAVMGNRTPQGVVSGDLESLAVALGYAGPMARVWAQTYAPLVDELEAAGVFSRGRDIDDDLDPDDIVSRRLYRERDRSQEKSEKCRQSALARWSKAKGTETDRVSMDEIRAEVAISECESDANAMRMPCESDANAMRTKNDDSHENKGDSEISGMRNDANLCLSPAQPNPSPTQPKPRGVQGGVVSIKHALATHEPLTGKQVYERLVEVTGDRKARAKWLNDVVNVFRKAGHLAVLDDHLLYFEGESGKGITQPSRLMAKKILQSARELSIEVPRLPGMPERAGRS